MINDRGAMKWTSLMLPEHVERLRTMKQDHNKRVKPVFDEQFFNELSEKVGKAIKEKYIVIVNVFDEYSEIRVEGRIVSLDSQLRRLKIESAGESLWVYFDDILEIQKA